MHPALRRYVQPPNIRTARYLVGGALTGLTAFLIAIGITSIAHERRADAIVVRSSP